MKFKNKTQVAGALLFLLLIGLSIIYIYKSFLFGFGEHSTTYAVYSSDNSMDSTNIPQDTNILHGANDNSMILPDIDLQNKFGYFTGHDEVKQRADGKFDVVLSSSPGIPSLVHIGKDAEAVVEIKGLSINNKSVEIVAKIDKLDEWDKDYGELRTAVFAINDSVIGINDNDDTVLGINDNVININDNLVASSFEIESATITLPKTGKVDYILRCGRFSLQEFECSDTEGSDLGGWEITDIPFVDNGDTITFTVAHFTGYAGGGTNETDIANLTVWDETDAEMPYGSQEKYTGDDVIFFANYSMENGTSIEKAECAINFTDENNVSVGNVVMAYDSEKLLYTYTRTFYARGTYEYNVTCDGSLFGYAELNSVDNVTILVIPLMGAELDPGGVLPSFTITPSPAYTTTNLSAVTSFADSTAINSNVTFNWYVNGSSTLALNMPFNQPFENASGNWTYDFSGNDNHCNLSLNKTDGIVANALTEASQAYWNETGGLNGSGAYTFNGSNAIDCGTASTVMPNAFTVMAWVKYKTSRDDVQPLISWITTNNPPVILLEYGEDIALIYLGVNNLRYFSHSIQVDNSLWHHIAFTVPGNANADITESKMYIDGVGQTAGTTSSNGAQTAKSVCFIGKGYGYTFNGTMDDFMLFNRALNDSTIYQIYLNGLRNHSALQNITSKETNRWEVWNATAIALNSTGGNGSTVWSSNKINISNSPPTNATEFNITPTIAYTTDNLSIPEFLFSDADSDKVNATYNWYVNGTSIAVLNMPFNAPVQNSSGNWTYDFSGNDYHGVSKGGKGNGNATWNQTGGLNGSGAYEFYGISGGSANDDYFVVGEANNKLNITGNQISVSVWVKAGTKGRWSDFGSYRCILGKSAFTGGDWNDGYGLYVHGDNTTVFWVNEWDVAFATKTNFTPDNLWHHIVGTYNGSVVSIWVDGIQGTTGAYNGDISSANWPFEIGRVYGGVGTENAYSFNGTIDEVMVFNRSLSTQQIYQIYRNGLNGEPALANITSDETNRWDVWNATAVAIDEIGLNGSTVWSSNKINITNTNATITSIVISPDTVYTNTTLNVTAWHNDSDRDAATIYFDWFINKTWVYANFTTDNSINTNASAELKHTNYTKWENVTVQIVAHDSAENNTPQNVSINITNSLPEVLGFAISPDEVWSNQSINATSIVWDIDTDGGDLVTAYFDWFLNRTTNSTNYTATLTNGTNISSILGKGNYSGGGNITVQIVLYDEYENSTAVNTSYFRITTCMDNITNGNETCDGPDINGLDCFSFGYRGGSLLCLSNCSNYDSSLCLSGSAGGAPPPSPPPPEEPPIEEIPLECTASSSCTDWGSCVNSQRTRTCTSTSSDCTTSTATETEECCPVSVVCDDWGACTNKVQQRKCILNTNQCTSLEAVETRDCLCESYPQCSGWGSCDETNTRYRTCIDLAACVPDYTESEKCCTPQIKCPLWDTVPCDVDGKQTRTCTDQANCNGDYTESRKCCESKTQCTPWEDIKCIAGVKARLCTDLNKCSADYWESEKCCEPNFICSLPEASQCMAGIMVETCRDINGCEPEYKREVACCFPEYDIPDFSTISCSDENGRSVKQIIIYDKNGCGPPRRFTVTCDENKIPNIAEEKLKVAKGRMAERKGAGYNLEIEEITLNKEHVYKNGEFVSGLSFKEDSTDVIEVVVFNNGQKPLSSLQMWFTAGKGINMGAAAPEKVERLLPGEKSRFVAEAETERIKTSTPFSLKISANELTLFIDLFATKLKEKQFYEQNAMSVLTNDIASTAVKNTPASVRWLLLFALPLLLLFQRNHLVDEDTLLAMAYNDMHKRYKALHTNAYAHERHNKIKTLKPLLLTSFQAREAHELAKQHQIPSNLAELLVVSRRKYRPTLITTVHIPKELKRKYWFVSFKNPFALYPEYQIYHDVKRLRFRGHGDDYILNYFARQGYPIDVVKSALLIRYPMGYLLFNDKFDKKLNAFLRTTRTAIRTAMGLEHGAEASQQDVEKREKISGKIAIKGEGAGKRSGNTAVKGEISGKRSGKTAVKGEMSGKRSGKTAVKGEISGKTAEAQYYQPAEAGHNAMLEDYAANQLKKGKTIPEIKKALLNIGWRNDIIDDALAVFELRNYISNQLDKVQFYKPDLMLKIKNRLAAAGWKKSLVEKELSKVLSAQAEKRKRSMHELVNYTEKLRKMGISPKKIKSKLKAVGWKKEIISYVLNHGRLNHGKLSTRLYNRMYSRALKKEHTGKEHQGKEHTVT